MMNSPICVTPGCKNESSESIISEDKHYYFCEKCAFLITFSNKKG